MAGFWTGFAVYKVEWGLWWSPFFALRPSGKEVVFFCFGFGRVSTKTKRKNKIKKRARNYKIIY